VFFLAAEQLETTNFRQISLQWIEGNEGLGFCIGLSFFTLRSFRQVDVWQWKGKFGGFVFFGHEWFGYPHRQRLGGARTVGRFKMIDLWLLKYWVKLARGVKLSRKSAVDQI
jgi:hypothetical protein